MSPVRRSRKPAIHLDTTQHDNQTSTPTGSQNAINARTSPMPHQVSTPPSPPLSSSLPLREVRPSSLLVTNPPVQMTVGTALSALNKPNDQAIVPHPALCSTNPAQIGPTSVPDAKAQLNNPYACAYAPCFPKRPGSLLSLASTTYVISAMSGGMTRVRLVPSSARRAQRRTICDSESWVTRRRRIRKGQARTKPEVASQRGP